MKVTIRLSDQLKAVEILTPVLRNQRGYIWAGRVYLGEYIWAEKVYLGRYIWEGISGQGEYAWEGISG